MGGAERAARRRKQRAQAAAASTRAVDSARSGSPDRGRILAVTGVVVLLVAAVVGGVLWQRSRSAPPAVTPVQAAVDYPVRVDGPVVVAGKPGAQTTVDLYEDFLCPACKAFEDRDAAALNQALSDGRVTVRYHMINLLDDRSNPPGYSLDAAAAGLCAADAGKFPAFHASLFASQPREGARGHSTDALIQLGQPLGITDPSFADCVRSGKHQDTIKAAYTAATADPALRRPGPNGSGSFFGTPTILVNGKATDISRPDWLTTALT